MLSIIKAKFFKSEFSIFISNDISDSLLAFLNTYKKKSVIIIADSIFQNDSYLPNKKMSRILKEYNTFYIKGGLDSKNFNLLERTIEYFVDNNLPRDGLVIALGGGVIGDLAGLASSIYHRGIDLCHVPTTMTSFVDSSVGGKTGINKNKIVNLVGTYHHPKAIFIDLRFLYTLISRDYYSGIAEVTKKSLVYDENFFKYLLDNHKPINMKNEDALSNLVKKSLEIKLHLTSQDTYEKSSRMLLNYGHTFGQAIETAFDLNHEILRHGEAVSLGMICASKMSEIIFKKKNIIDLHKNILDMFNLPISMKKIDSNFMDIKKIRMLINNDKKRTSKASRFILISKVGKGEIIEENDKNLIEEAISEIF